MDTHRIEFDRTDDDHVSGGVAQQLEFELFQPKIDCSISTSCTGEACRPRFSAASNSSRVFTKPPPVPPQRKRRTNHQRKADLLGDLLAFENEVAVRPLQTPAFSSSMRSREFLPVFGLCESRRCRHR